MMVLLLVRALLKLWYCYQVVMYVVCCGGGGLDCTKWLRSSLSRGAGSLKQSVHLVPSTYSWYLLLHPPFLQLQQQA